MKRCLLIYILLFPLLALAQQQWVVQQHLTLKEGLPQNTIRDMQYDKYGYLWLGTECGLARWDGKNLRVVTHKDAPNLLQSGRILHINKDENGRMIILPESYPAVYMCQTGSFSFKNIAVDSPIYFEPSRYHFWAVNRIFACKDLPHVPALRKAIESRKGSRVFSTDGITGVVVLDTCIVWFDGHHIKAAKMVISIADQLFLLDNTLYSIRPNGALFRYLPDSAPECITTGSLYKLLKQTNSVADVRAYCSHESPLLYDHKNVYFLSTRNGIPEIDTLAANVQFPITSVVLYNARTGILAVGTVTDGLYLLQRNYFKTLRQPPVNKKLDEYGNIFYGLQPYSKDYIFTEHGLLPLGERGKFIPLADMQGFAMGRWNGYYLLSDVRLGKIVMMDSSLTEQEFLLEPRGVVYHFEPLNKDTLLILLPDVLVSYKLPTHTYDTIINYNHKDDGFRCMLKLNDSIVAIGAWKNMWLCNIVRKSLTPIPNFQGVNIRNFYRDKEGIIWIGTFGSGFYSWDGIVLKHFPTDRKGNLEVINGILEDNKGYLWVITNNGLFRFLRNDLKAYTGQPTDKLFYNYFDQSDGLVANEFNNAAPSAVVLADSSFAFGSMSGVVIMPPDKIHFRNPQLKVYIDKVTVDSFSVLSPGSGTLKVPTANELLQFEVSTPYASNPYEVQLFYRLSGGSPEWNELQPNGKITFNRLGKGDYQMQFRLVRSGGDAYESFAFTVLPLWYETTLARSAFVLVALLIIALLYLAGTRALRQQKARLEIQVDERTKGLNTTVVQLNDTISRLRDSEEELYHSQKQREKFSAMVLHDLQSPLKFLSGITDQLYQRLTTGNTDDMNEMAFELKKSTHQVTQFSNDYLNWLKSNTGKEKEKEWIDARPILERVCALFTQLANSRNNTLICNSGPEIMVFTIPDYLEIIIRNLVDNANKHTFQGVIALDCFERDNKKHIRITDTGEGVNSAGLRQINDLFAGTETTIKSDSLGLQIVYDLLAKCGGSLKAESTPGKGMEITLSFAGDKDA